MHTNTLLGARAAGVENDSKNSGLARVFGSYLCPVSSHVARAFICFEPPKEGCTSENSKTQVGIQYRASDDSSVAQQVDPETVVSKNCPQRFISSII